MNPGRPKAMGSECFQWVWGLGFAVSTMELFRLGMQCSHGIANQGSGH